MARGEKLEKLEKLEKALLLFALLRLTANSWLGDVARAERGRPSSPISAGEWRACTRRTVDDT